MQKKAQEALALGITDLHIVGGLHPSLPFTYYKDMLKGLKEVSSDLQLKCFTAIKNPSPCLAFQAIGGRHIKIPKRLWLRCFDRWWAEIFQSDQKKNSHWQRVCCWYWMSIADGIF